MPTIPSSRDQHSIQGTGGQRGGVLSGEWISTVSGGELQPGGAQRHHHGSTVTAALATELLGVTSDSHLLPSSALFSFPLVI